ncbi:MAG: response regulator [Armatimonadetes bacterium]|jgi:two-component system chemotaxis response regulator CheY|nr:response regulator [Armatimonadota bacterium]MDW8152878.1 response regulator [Armatimonadota bacterium]
MSARVLVVDDAAFMRAMLREVLTNSGFQVVGEASNGLEAIERYEETKPDVVTMDITMPEMDGVRAVREILRRDPAARIVMVSAMGQQALVVEAIQAGARDFVVKPFDQARLVEAIRRALR